MMVIPRCRIMDCLTEERAGLLVKDRVEDGIEDRIWGREIKTGYRLDIGIGQWLVVKDTIWRRIWGLGVKVMVTKTGYRQDIRNKIWVRWSMNGVPGCLGVRIKMQWLVWVAQDRNISAVC